MARSLRSFGFLLLAAVAALAMISQMIELPFIKEFLTVGNTTAVAFLAGAMIAAGIVLPILSGAAGTVAGKRCARCSKRVEKNQMYCHDHQKAALEEMRDHQKNMEDTSYGRKSGRKK